MKRIWRVLVIGAMIVVSGPGLSIAQWVEVSRPEGWRINDLLVEGPFLFAATDRGVFRSADDGESWDAVSSGLRNSIVTSIAATQTSLLVGTMDGSYRSTDLGSSWTAANSGLFRDGPMDVCWPAVTIGSEIFVGSDDGVFRSDDGGESWTTANFGLPRYLHIDGLAAIGSDLFAATNKGVYRTVNRGLDWVRVDLSQPNPAKVGAVTVIGETLFAGSNRGISFSSDRGTSWEEFDLGVRTNQLWSLSADDDKLCAWFDRMLFVITRQGEKWVAERSSLPDFHCAKAGVNREGPLADLYRRGFEQSIDRGASRIVLDREALDDSLEDLYVIADHLYADTGDGLFRSIDDGATWESLDAELPRTLSVNAFFSGEAGLFAGTESGVFLSTDNGKSWTSASPGEIEVYDLAAMGPGLFAGTDEGVFVTRDDGKNWNKTNLILPRFSDVSSLAVLDTALVADTDEGTFVTRDGGETWLEIDSDQLDDFDWEDIEVVGKALFFGGYDGVFRSSDIGSTWVDVSQGLPEDGSVSHLTAIGNQLFLISSDGRVFRTVDRGTTWRATAALPSSGYPGMLAAVGDDLVAATSEGIFLFADTGESWTALKSDPLWHGVQALSKAGTNFIAGTRGAGIFVHEGNGGGWKPASEGLPRGFNYPGSGFVAAGRYLFVGTIDSVYKSVDFGRSWNRDTSLKTDGPLVMSLAVVGNDVLMGTSSRVFRSTDDGQSWEKMRPELARWPGIENLRVVGSTLFADVDKYGTYFLTPDGEDWEGIDDEFGSEVSAEFDGMTTLAVFGETIFARKNNRVGLFVSTDGGKRWSMAGAGMPEAIEVTSIGMYWKNLHARSENEHFISTDGGTSWISIGSGPPDGTMIWDYSISDTQVFARSKDGEVWRQPRLESPQPR